MSLEFGMCRILVLALSLVLVSSAAVPTRQLAPSISKDLLRTALDLARVHARSDPTLYDNQLIMEVLWAMTDAEFRVDRSFFFTKLAEALTAAQTLMGSSRLKADFRDIVRVLGAQVRFSLSIAAEDARRLQEGKPTERGRRIVDVLEKAGGPGADEEGYFTKLSAALDDINHLMAAADLKDDDYVRYAHIDKVLEELYRRGIFVALELAKDLAEDFLTEQNKAVLAVLTAIAEDIYGVSEELSARVTGLVDYARSLGGPYSLVAEVLEDKVISS